MIHDRPDLYPNPLLAVNESTQLLLEHRKPGFPTIQCTVQLHTDHYLITPWCRRGRQHDGQRAPIGAIRALDRQHWIAHEFAMVIDVPYLADADGCGAVPGDDGILHINVEGFPGRIACGLRLTSSMRTMVPFSSA